MKKILTGLSLISMIAVANAMQGSAPVLPMPKVASHKSLKSLDRHGRTHKATKHKKAMGKAAHEIQAAELSQADREDMTDFAIAASMRFAGNEKPLIPEFQDMVKSMDSLSEAYKWRLLGLMQKFDATAKANLKGCDEQLAKIRDEMSSIDSGTHHAHAPKAKHKRGDSF